MIDDVRITYLALEQTAAPLPGELNVLPVKHHDGLFLGLDDKGRQHLLLTAEEGVVVPISDIASLDLTSRVLTVAGTPTTFLDVSCLFEALAEVFDYFVVAVIERLADGTRRPDQAVTEILAQWRQFLVAGIEPGRDRLAAVFGELVVLLDVVRALGESGLDAWVGPFGGRHDLRRGSTALEVKTTRSHTSRAVTIHGEDQLLEPDDAALYLHLVRLEEVPDGGRSVSTVVDEILAAGIGTRPFFEALAAAGIPPAGLAAADRIRFDIRERITFPVDDRIPRIVPASFASGARPAGVLDLSYRIDLDHAIDLALDATAYARIVGELAGVQNG